MTGQIAKELNKRVYKIEWRYWATTNLIIILEISSLYLFSHRDSITIKSCKQAARIVFGKHIIVLLDRNIICKLPLQFVDVYIGSAIFRAICVLSMTRIQFQDLDRFQRNMFRRITSCLRIYGENLRDIIFIMNQRLFQTHQLNDFQLSAISFVRNQWRYVHHVIDVIPLLWIRNIIKCSVNPVYDPEMFVFLLESLKSQR